MSRMLMLDYNKCKPEDCHNGICCAVQACPLDILGQEEPYDKPMMYSPVCKGCMECFRACPNSALELN